MNCSLIALFAVLGATANDTNFTPGRVTINDTYGVPTCATASTAGSLCADEDIECNDDLDVGDDATIRGAMSVSETLLVAGDLTINGGAGALTVSGSGASTLVAADADSTAFCMGAAGALDLVCLDTTDATPSWDVKGVAGQVSLHVDAGTAQLDESPTVGAGAAGTDYVINFNGETSDGTLQYMEDEDRFDFDNLQSDGTFTAVGISTLAGVTSTAPALLLQTIRFCGNGFNGATATYMGPVLLDDTEADLAFGGAGCDALENATIGTADAPWHAAFAFKPVSMVCVGTCTGASAANDAPAFALYDDTAAVADMTCTGAAWTGDGTLSQCTVTDTVPATVAANSAIAIKISGTDDVCSDAGDDFECLLYVTF